MICLAGAATELKCVNGLTRWRMIDPPFSSWLPPSRVRWGAAGRRRKRASTFCTGMPDFLFYLEFEMVIQRFTFTSRKEIKLFSNFPLHIYFNERDKTFNAMKGDFV